MSVFILASPHSRARFTIVGALIGALLAASNCARFRIEELEPRPIFSTPVLRMDSANNTGGVQLAESGRVSYNLPLRPAGNGSRVYVADPARRVVRAFAAGSTTEPDALLLGTAAREVGGDASSGPRRVSLKFGIPGWVAVDADDERLYIQSFAADSNPVTREEQPIENRQSARTSLLRQIASRVLVVDPDNGYAVLGTLGQEGYGDATPFDEILALHPGENGRVAVLYRETGAKQNTGPRGQSSSPRPTLALYDNGELDYRYVIPEELLSAEEKRQAFIDYEEIVAGPDGDFAIFSVALRDKSSYALLNRRIYRMARGDGAATELLRIDDPADYFVSARPDGGFYLMNAEEDGTRILFKTFDASGEYLNNRLIVFPGLRASWRETFLDHAGRIFSSRLYAGKFELYEWN